MWATEDPEKVRTLLEKGANVNARSGDGQTAMLIALEEACDSEVVKLLMDHGAEVTTDQGIDPLVTPGQNADPKTMQLLAALYTGRPLSPDKPWKRAFGGLRHLHKETKRVNRIVQRELDAIDEDQWR